MSRTIMGIIFAGLLGAGCATGASLAGYAPAHGPAGAQVTVGLPAQKISGELLVVEDSTLLLVVREGTTPLVRIPTRAIRGVTGPDGKTRELDDGLRDRWRLISRYPAGITADLERRLLVAYGTDAVRWVES